MLRFALPPILLLAMALPASAFNVHQFNWEGVRPGDSLAAVMRKTGRAPTSPHLVASGTGVFRFEREGVGPVYVHLYEGKVTLIRHYYLSEATKRMGGVKGVKEKMTKALSFAAARDSNSITWNIRFHQRTIKLWTNHPKGVVIDFAKEDFKVFVDPMTWQEK